MSKDKGGLTKVYLTPTAGKIMDADATVYPEFDKKKCLLHDKMMIMLEEDMCFSVADLKRIVRWWRKYGEENYLLHENKITQPELAEKD